jgi:hypothetical protein
MSDHPTLRRFVFDALLLEDTFAGLERQGIGVRITTESSVVERVSRLEYDQKIIADAKKMASVFVAFFCLENSVRDLIEERLRDRHGIDWWEKKVSTRIQEAAATLKQKEQINRYHANRSASLIGYTTFGQLAQIIIGNWDDFTDLFPDQAWVNSRFRDLEVSRNIIMHTGVLPPSEIDRIESISRDWVSSTSRSTLSAVS